LGLKRTEFRVQGLVSCCDILHYLLSTRSCQKEGPHPMAL
jgi:hypothetical protein